MMYKLHTTYTSEFLGLHQNAGVWRETNHGKGIIIGVLDSGITLGHPSFDDTGVPPPPSKWKGVFGCNNKLIGVMDLTDSAGIHCMGKTIFEGMHAAVADGVDVLSVSIGVKSLPFYKDAIAIGAFRAIQEGICVCCAAGNSGPFYETLSNEAPWILTVGASTVDRKMKTSVHLGNHYTVDGESSFRPTDFPQNFLPLVYPGLHGGDDAAWCRRGSLKHIDVKGKIVVCDIGGGIPKAVKGQTIADAGGARMIVVNTAAQGETTDAEVDVLPASHVGYVAGEAIKSYIRSTPYPVARMMFDGTVIGENTAIRVPSFSSRGPSRASPGILKLDIIGPGSSILAAWHVPLDWESYSMATFNTLSGSSMACPHLACPHEGIKSAIMTTADQVRQLNYPSFAVT